jgi:hypothetical protein
VMLAVNVIYDITLECCFQIQKLKQALRFGYYKRVALGSIL